MNSQITAANARTIDVGGDLTVSRLGFGAMRITGRVSGVIRPTGTRLGRRSDGR
jgi:hypothetical protein